MADISIVIACYNGAATLAQTLDSLAAQSFDGDWEIVLANNGSTDASIAIFEALARRRPDLTLRVVDASARRGKPFALNVGIKAARGRGILTFDADDTVEAGWLAAMAAALERTPLIAARMNFVRLNPGWVREYRSDGEDLIFHRLEHAPFCDLAGGCQLGFLRRLFDEVGDYDPAFAALEDHDWVIRAFLLGHALQPVPEAVVNYRFRDDARAIFRQTYGYARHRALLRRRYAPSSIFAPRAWLELGDLALRASASRLVGRAVRRDAAPLARARYARVIGGALGDAAGSLAFGVAPSRSRRADNAPRRRPEADAAASARSL